MVRETPIEHHTRMKDSYPQLLKPYEEVNNRSVIASTRNAFEAGRDDREKVFNGEAARYS